MSGKTSQEFNEDAWVHPTLKRYLAFEFTPHLWKGRYATWLLCVLCGLGLLALQQRVWFGVLALVAGMAGCLYVWRQGKIFRDWVYHRAVPARGVVLMANEMLYKRGSIDHPLAVLFCLDSGFTSNTPFLAEVAKRLYALLETPQTDPELQAMAEMMQDYSALHGRRRKIARALTDGHTVYMSDMIVERRLLRKGRLEEMVLYCLIEPGEKGRIELIPWQVVEAENAVLM